jgi:hypothetical protein
MAADRTLYIDLTEDDIFEEDDEPSIAGVWGFSGAGTAAGEGMWCLAGPDAPELGAPAFPYAGMPHVYAFCGRGADWEDIDLILGALPGAASEAQMASLFPGSPPARAAARLAWRAKACGGSFIKPSSGVPTFTPLMLIQTPVPLIGFTTTAASSFLDGRSCEQDGYSFHEIVVASGHQPSEWSAEWLARLQASWTADDSDDAMAGGPAGGAAEE